MTRIPRADHNYLLVLAVSNCASTVNGTIENHILLHSLTPIKGVLYTVEPDGISNQPEGLRRLFSIPKDPKIQNHVPYGGDIFVKLSAQNIREKRNRQDITRTVRIFFNPNPRIFSRSANLPR